MICLEYIPVTLQLSALKETLLGSGGNDALKYQSDKTAAAKCTVKQIQIRGSILPCIIYVSVLWFVDYK